MKIQNTGLQPLSAKPTNNTNPIEKKEELNGTESVGTAKDKVEMSRNARLLAKARAALGNTDDADTERLALLKQQIASGDYTVQVSELARKLLAKFPPK